MSELFSIPSRLLVAVGGNATHPEDIEGTSAEQAAIAASTAKALLPITSLNNELIITHGNGPVVGKILMRQVLTRDTIAPMPLDICVAHSQGGIAYLLMQAIENSLRETGNERHCAVLLTQVEVDEHDAAFNRPSKPIGAFYTEEEAKQIGDELGWLMKEDSGRGWRHVVPSPVPRHICDVSLVQELSQRGTIVIAGGGGGIPVIRLDHGVRKGVAAVIDKDLTSAHMANIMNIPVLMILTAVSQVAIHFGTKDETLLNQISLSEIKRYRDDGHFPEGSMGPKIDAAIRFLEGGGQRVVIGHVDEVLPALTGATGTHIVTDDAIDS